MGIVSTQKNLTPIRWMGCVLAVYEYTVREKSEVKGRKLRGKNRRKRRGRRKGKLRERARLVTSRSPPFSTVQRVANARLATLSKVHDRYIRWARSRLGVIAALSLLRYGLKPGSLRRRETVKLLYQAKLRWVTTSAARNGDSLEFAWVRLRVALEIVTAGWESITLRGGVSRAITNAFECFEEAWIGAIRFPQDYRAVSQPASLSLPGKRSKAWGNVAKANRPICRACGARGHLASDCRSPLSHNRPEEGPVKPRKYKTYVRKPFRKVRNS